MSADKYMLRVTAGPTYDLKTQVEIPVNSSSAPTEISSSTASSAIAVRIQNYRGLPRNSPTTSAYFSTAPHSTNHDQYSISIRFELKKPPGSTDEGVSAADLQFGNDFDHPIRDRLPPGFNTALNIVKWWIDPGLDGDAYADSPHLYGPALSSFNAVHCGAGQVDAKKGGLWVEEGGSDSEGSKGRLAERQKTGAPDDAKARMKWALRADAKKSWVWRYGQSYAVDFFNPYLDFSEFSLKLPGFTLPIMKYWDGQGLRASSDPFKRSHALRYVLRNKSTGEVYLVILFTIYRREDVNEDGSLKPAALEAMQKASGGVVHGEPPAKGHGDDHDAFDEDKALAEAKRKLSGVHAGEGPGTFQDDDVD